MRGVLIEEFRELKNKDNIIPDLSNVVGRESVACGPTWRQNADRPIVNDHHSVRLAMLLGISSPSSP
jgi:hypothetical protein